jgi:GT2 family glycosyltransferase
VDLAWRARIAGWRCLYVPGARVLHMHSATSREGSPFKSYHLGRNKIWLLTKNYPWRRLWPYALWVLLYDALAVGYGVVVRGDWASLRGRVAGWLGSPKVWRKRGKRHNAQRADIRWLAPVRWPWQIRRDLSYLDRLRS